MLRRDYPEFLSETEGIADIVGTTDDGSVGFLLVVKVPIPASEATPVFVRVTFGP